MKAFNYSLLSTICALIIGVLLVVWPDVAVNYLVISIGVLFLIPGLTGIFYYFATEKSRREQGIKNIFPIPALGSVIFGFWLMIMPEFFVGILMYVLGILLVLAGLSQLMKLISVRNMVNVPFIMYVFSVLILFAGMLVLFNPFSAAAMPFMILGISAIFYALTDLLRLIRYRKKQIVENRDVVDITPIEEIKE